MALSSATSGLISATISVLIIGVMQIFKAPIADSQLGTIFGGFLGSQLFVFLLTAVSNFEMSAFGSGFQARIFPEIVFTMLTALFVSSTVHRVCITTCFLFSLGSLYYLNKISHSLYGSPTQAQSIKKKKFWTLPRNFLMAIKDFRKPHRPSEGIFVHFLCTCYTNAWAFLF